MMKHDRVSILWLKILNPILDIWKFLIIIGHKNIELDHLGKRTYHQLIPVKCFIIHNKWLLLHITIINYENKNNLTVEIKIP